MKKAIYKVASILKLGKSNLEKVLTQLETYAEYLEKLKNLIQLELQADSKTETAIVA